MAPAGLLVLRVAVAQPAPPEPGDTGGASDRLDEVEARLRVLEERVRAAEARAARAEARLEAEDARHEDALQRDDYAAEEPATAAEVSGGVSGPTVAVDGYLEVNYSYNFNRPENGITDYRGFDNRHNTFTLSNAMLGATGAYDRFTARVALQVGHTPSTYYLGEPSSPGGAASATTDRDVFKYVQEAHVGYEVPIGRGLDLRAGVLLSPVGYEAIAVKDNFNWSRSNLFFGLPFYHTGVQATYSFAEEIQAMVMVCNGMTGVVDNNDGKSLAAQWVLRARPETLTVSLLYFGGPERDRGVSESASRAEPWRHLFDVWVEAKPVAWLTLAAHGDAGFERNVFGTSWWAAGAAYLRARLLPWMFVAVRGDVFREHAAVDASGNRASPMFWPVALHGSGTATLDVRPNGNLALRFEYRHDEADEEMFFEGAVAGDGVSDPYVPNTRRQDTLTIGATGWF